MADQSDVEAALCAAVLAAASPGIGQFPLLGGQPIRVYRGTAPVTGSSVDRRAGISDISVSGVANTLHNTTRWSAPPSLLAVTGGLSATANEQTATFTGSAVAGELAGLLVNGQPFVYSAQQGDSAALVAAALADLVRVTQIVWVSGSSVTIPAAATLAARTAGVASVVQELGRQEQVFRIGVTSPSPAARDAVCAALLPPLAATAFITLADGTGARVRFSQAATSDADQVASIYRRDLLFSVDYGTTSTTQSAVMLFGDSDYNTVATFI